MYQIVAEVTNGRLWLTLRSGRTDLAAAVLDLKPGEIIAERVSSWARAHRCDEFELVVTDGGKERTGGAGRLVFDRTIAARGVWFRRIPGGVVPVELTRIFE